MPILNKEEMPLDLHQWISIATLGHCTPNTALCQRDHDRIEDEIIAHYYESYWEAANSGLDHEASHASAMKSLGSENQARRAFVRENLTVEEEDMLYRMEGLHENPQLSRYDFYWGFGTTSLYMQCFFSLWEFLHGKSLYYLETLPIYLFISLCFTHYSVRKFWKPQKILVFRNCIHAFCFMEMAIVMAITDGLLYPYFGINFAALVGMSPELLIRSHPLPLHFIVEYIVKDVGFLGYAIFILMRTFVLVKKYDRNQPLRYS